MRGMESICPSCGKTVTVWKNVLTATEKQEKHRLEAQIKSERISSTARTFTGVAGWLAAVGVLSLVFFMVKFAGGEIPLWLAYISGGSFGLAMWFYLLAQIIYIRAALEK